MENLSFPVPEKPFEISDEDFMKTVLDYTMFQEGVDSKKLQEKLMENVMYNSNVTDNGNSISISIEKEDK